LQPTLPAETPGSATDSIPDKSDHGHGVKLNCVVIGEKPYAACWVGFGAWVAPR
jgi:hypothetical protein